MSQALKEKQVKVDVELGVNYSKYYVDRSLFKFFQQFTTYRHPNYMFIDSVKAGRWDGVYHLERIFNGGLYIPTGLIYRIEKNLREKGFVFNYKNCLTYPEFKNVSCGWNNNYSVRYYQKEAVESCLNYRRGIVQAATGSGKMLNAVYLYYKTGLKTLILVVSKEAARDTYKEFLNVLPGVDVSIWDNKKPKFSDVVVATIQSFYNDRYKNNEDIKNLLGSYELLIVDEVHFLGAPELFKIVMSSNAPYRFGQSATPYRQDKKDIYLEAAIGPIIYVKNLDDLQDEGFLANSKIFFINTLPPDNIAVKDLVRLKPQSYYIKSVVENVPRNNIIKDLYDFLLKNDRRCLFVVKSIEHGNYLSELLQLPFIHGKLSSKERAAYQEKLFSGEIKSAVVSIVYDQSVNIPVIDTLVDCSGHSPEIKVIQRLGRILRKFPGKDFSLYITFFDWWDNGVRKHSQKRLKILSKFGQKPVIIDLKDFIHEYTRIINE